MTVWLRNTAALSVVGVLVAVLIAADGSRAAGGEPVQGSLELPVPLPSWTSLAYEARRPDGTGAEVSPVADTAVEAGEIPGDSAPAPLPTVDKNQDTIAPRKPETPYVAPVQVDNSGTELYALALAYFPEQPERAYRIAMCESGGRTDAVGRLGELGIFQVHPLHGAVPADAEGQVAQARAIYLRAGSWAPWSCR